MNVRDIIDAARAATGLSDPGDPTALEGLEVLVRASDAEASLSTAGAQRWKPILSTSCRTVCASLDYLKKHPELLERPVERPMFVFGLPRTGTTLTINLLSADPMRRCLLRWEALNPVPRRRLVSYIAIRAVWRSRSGSRLAVKYAPQIAAAHYEDADSPTECQFAMALSFCAQDLRFQCPRPSYGHWLMHEASYLPAFRFHKQLLHCCKRRTQGAGP